MYVKVNFFLIIIIKYFVVGFVLYFISNRMIFLCFFLVVMCNRLYLLLFIGLLSMLLVLIGDKSLFDLNDSGRLDVFFWDFCKVFFWIRLLLSSILVFGIVEDIEESLLDNIFFLFLKLIFGGIKLFFFIMFIICVVYVILILKINVLVF